MIFTIFTLFVAVQLVNGNNFATELFYDVAKENQNENVIMSPVSIQTGLSMLYFGADGKTADEIVNCLSLGTTNKNDIANKFHELINYSKNSSYLNVASKVFVNQLFELSTEFNDVTKKAFGCSPKNLDFNNPENSVKTINDWVEEKTNKKIQNLVSSNLITPETSMLLVNTIHFKALWARKFSDSKKSEFFTSSTTKVPIDMIQLSESFQYSELKDLDATAIEIPYLTFDDPKSYSMMIILPNKIDGLFDLEKKLKSINLIEQSKEFHNKYITVEIPKFKAEFSLQMVDTLKEMGIKTMFTPAADFHNFFKNPSNVLISDVVHKAVISVDEHGTEAAAATFSIPVPVSGYAGPPPLVFKADHPFVYAIRDHEFIYFAGHVVKF